jgi:hypothetical protein
MKFKHFKFPPQSYAPRISFNLIIQSDLVITDDLEISFDKPMSIALSDLDTKSASIDTDGKSLGEELK